MEIKFFSSIINKTKKDRVKNTNIRLDLGADEIKNGIFKSSLRWFGYLMQMTPKKMLHKKMEGK